MAQFGATPDITAEVSRIFMAIQIQCAQCHDHPFDRWKRTQFHELAAFFPRIALRPVKPADKQKRSFDVIGVDRRTAGESEECDDPARSLEHYMPDLKNPTAKGTLMQPVFFVTGQKLPLGTPDAERRETIARWITSPQDEWFAKAFVNRIWSEMVGEGFYEPVDDIGPDRDCNAPETLDYLAKQFVAHQLRREMALSHDRRHRRRINSIAARGTCRAKRRFWRIARNCCEPTKCSTRWCRPWASKTKRSIARPRARRRPYGQVRATPAACSTSCSATIRACGATKCPARFRRRWC